MNDGNGDGIIQSGESYCCIVDNVSTCNGYTGNVDRNVKSIKTRFIEAGIE